MKIKNEFGECLSFTEEERSLVNKQLVECLQLVLAHKVIWSKEASGIEKYSRILMDIYRYG